MSKAWLGQAHAEAMQGQHFSLALHTGIEPFSGWILQVKLWHSNHNHSFSYCTTWMLLKKWDCNLDTENFGIANPQILLWLINDPALEVFQISSILGTAVADPGSSP
ncbi:hypothetical protein EV401DRAFT_1893204 [Pisolithus croceorrhizus]|nr:hypothetical protein EV401DRAFT_1893204 [Pisolithus croceorrhizus]